MSNRYILLFTSFYLVSLRPHTILGWNNYLKHCYFFRSVIKFLDRNFLFIEKVQAFLDLILSRALAGDKI